MLDRMGRNITWSKDWLKARRLLPVTSTFYRATQAPTGSPAADPVVSETVRSRRCPPGGSFQVTIGVPDGNSERFGFCYHHNLPLTCPM